jgi:hypothetical protein
VREAGTYLFASASISESDSKRGFTELSVNPRNVW